MHRLDARLKERAPELMAQIANRTQELLVLGIASSDNEERRNQETMSFISSCNQDAGAHLGSTEASMLFERYGDIMGVIDNHPLFKPVTRAREDGGWGIYPQALTNAVKKYAVDGDYGAGLDKVLDAIRYTKNYPAARNKAAFFWSVMENGKKPKQKQKPA